MVRRLLTALALLTATLASPAAAEVTLSFYSFNGAFGGRFPTPSYAGRGHCRTARR